MGDVEVLMGVVADALRWRAIRDMRLVGMKRGDLEWLVEPGYWGDKYPDAADFDTLADAVVREYERAVRV